MQQRKAVHATRTRGAGLQRTTTISSNIAAALFCRLMLAAGIGLATLGTSSPALAQTAAQPAAQAASQTKSQSSTPAPASDSTAAAATTPAPANTVPAPASSTGPTTASAAAESRSPSVLPMLIVLIFVLGLIPLALWVLKRLGAGAPAAHAGLRVIGQLPLGTRERIVILEAGERWLLLGVTPTQITRVGTLPKGELPNKQVAPQAFAALLAKLNKPGGTTK